MDFFHAEFSCSYGISTQLPPTDRIEIAFAGRSNVGKSSLINKLLNRKALARVSAVPGKTATINFYDVDKTIFVDLPGYGYAKVSKGEKTRWSELIEGYFAQDRNLQLVVSLIDIRHSPSKLDVDMVNFLIDNELPFIVVLTKADKLSKNQQKERLKALMSELPCAEDITILPVSSEKGDGIEELRSIIADIADEYEKTEE